MRQLEKQVSTVESPNLSTGATPLHSPLHIVCFNIEGQMQALSALRWQKLLPRRPEGGMLVR